MKKTISMMMALAVAGTMAAPAMAVNDEPMVIAPAPNAQSQQAQNEDRCQGQDHARADDFCERLHNGSGPRYLRSTRL
ncbi:MAG: hypothetical protein ACLUT5_14490 [Butyricicoccus sp.]